MSTAFDLTQVATVFTKLDLRNAYPLVRIREGDEWKTAFNTPNDHYKYLVMPFALTNAPAVSQTLVNKVLRDMINQYIFVYLDNILVFSKDMSSQLKHVSSVLVRLLQNNLLVKAKKCQFYRSSTSFLGFVTMDSGKVSAVINWPVPIDRKQLQRFLGLANLQKAYLKL